MRRVVGRSAICEPSVAGCSVAGSPVVVVRGAPVGGGRSHGLDHFIGLPHGVSSGSAAPAASATCAVAASAAAAARVFRGWTLCALIAVLCIFSRVRCGPPCSAAAALAFFDFSLSSSDCRFRCCCCSCCCNAHAADPARRRGRRLEAMIAAAIRSLRPPVAPWHRPRSSSRRRWGGRGFFTKLSQVPESPEGEAL